MLCSLARPLGGSVRSRDISHVANARLAVRMPAGCQTSMPNSAALAACHRPRQLCRMERSVGIKFLDNVLATQRDMYRVQLGLVLGLVAAGVTLVALGS